MRKPSLFFVFALVPLDALMLFCAGLSAYFLRTSSFIAEWRPVLFYLNLPFERYALMLAAIIPFWLLVFALTGLYRTQRSDVLQEFFHVIASCSFAVMAVIVYIFATREWFDSRFIIIASWAFSIVYVLVGRWVFRGFQRYLIATRRMGTERVLLVGDNEATHILAREMERDRSLGYTVAGRIAATDIDEIKRAMAGQNIDTVLVGDADYAKEAIAELAEFCRDMHLNFRFAPTLFQTLTTHVEMNVIGGVPLIEVKHTALDGWGRVAKRVADLFGSALGLALCAPFFGVVAVWIKLDSKGPVMVALDRVTLGRRFTMYKFRSMVDNAHELKPELMRYNERKDGGPLFKIHNDPRVTRAGRFLRKTRIDELPQLWNVLKGEMSLVGPRPHEPEEVARYEAHHKKLLVIKAGMTGMAQTSGSSDLPFEEEVKLDTYYIENWSLLLDIKILFRTCVVLFRDRSAC